MNYWLLTTEFPPHHGGGISTYCQHTVNMMSANNINVKVFLYDYSVDECEVTEISKNCQLIRFNPDKGKQSQILGFEARLSFEYAQIVEKFIQLEGKPDYIETQDYMGIGYYLQQKSWLNYPLLEGIPIVVTMHAPSFLYLEFNQTPLYKLPDYWTGEMEKASIAMADLLLSPSQYLIDVLEEKLDVALKAKKLFNPFCSPEQIENQLKEKEIIFFGKLTPQKGCLELFKYLQNMWDDGFELPIHIVGGGDHFFYPQQLDMIDYIKSKYSTYWKKGLIVFEGKIAPEQLKERIKSAHIVVVPSIVDNLPYVVIEAMSLRKIVLASENGGHKELITSGENGFLFSHEEENFREVLLKILELRKGKVLEIGEKAKKTIENELDYPIIFSKKISLLKSIRPRKKTFVFSRKTLHQEKEISISADEKLSVVIPYYNLGGTIEDTLVSLQNVNYPNIEIILVNDGSTEPASIEKLESLAGKYKFTLLHKKNSGLSETRNFGAEHSNGAYLAFLDADDTVEPDYYKKAIELLSNYNNLHFVGCWAQYFGESQKTWPTFNPEPPYLLYHNMINSSALVYKKESFLKFGMNKKKLIYGMEDYESLISMVKNGARGVAIPELWWNYRIRKNSMQQAFNVNKQLYLYRLIAEEHEDFFNLYGSELSKILNHNGPGYRIENPTWGRAQVHFYQKFLPQPFIQLIKKNPLLRKTGKFLYNRLKKT